MLYSAAIAAYFELSYETHKYTLGAKYTVKACGTYTYQSKLFSVT
jgi:hypothetical protein